jgi:phospholipid/cholesterol/gamma-HCH transport system permease protein
MDALIDVKAGADLIEVTGSGAWVAVNAQRLETLTEKILSFDTRRIEINARGISQFDTFGAVALDRLTRGDGRHDIALTGLSARYADLYEKVRACGRGAPPTSENPEGLSAKIAGIGVAVYALGVDALRYLNMIGAFAVVFGGVVARPRRMRFASLAHQIDRVGWRSIPIIALITLLIGGIIAQQGFYHFRRFGADDYVVDLVAILILREIGVLLVAIMVAGRSGSAYTAELGSMKMREEVDALRTMGRDPMEVLILPRVLALVVALPALTFLGSMAALFGGGAVAWFYGGMDPAIFVARLREAVSIGDFEVGMTKAPFMALVIGIVACTEGLKVQGSAESLGLQTTTSVVKSIFMVIVLDGLFAMFFSSIGM